MSKEKKPIKYTSRDFDSIKRDLVEYAKRYYPDTFRDFNEASFGSLMLDTVAYVGDVLSFYLDYNINETFLDSASEYDNIIRLSKQMGYKFKSNPSSFGLAAFYVIVPANSTGLGPDTNYLPILHKGTKLTSTSGNGFMLEEDVHFEDTSNEIVVARVDDTTGVPTSYAVRAYGKIASGIMEVEKITVGSFKKFRKVPLSSKNIADIISVVDSDGNEYFEVDYLSQNVIYKEVANRGADSTTVPSILKPMTVPRRFVVERSLNSINLQFGYGSTSELQSPSVVDPTNVVLQMHGRDYITDQSFDPSKLLKTDKFGISPTNTTLTISYRTNTPGNVNAAAGSVTQVAGPVVSFKDVTSLSNGTMSEVKNSIECFNDEPIVGDISLPTSEELRRRTIDHFATQNRAVTQQDYEALVYAMPEKFGSIKRCRITRDPDSFRRNLNLYVISEDSFGKLTATNTTIKENLKTWLGRVKMIHDTIDILDAKIANIGIEFEVVSGDQENRFDVLSNCVLKLKERFASPMYIGEPLYISEIYSILNKVRGVADTKNVKIVQKTGTNYASIRLDVESLVSADARYLSVPENVLLEIKYPDNDIKGAIS
jgi:hypothetical protein